MRFFHKISTRILFGKFSRNFLHSKAHLFPNLQKFSLVLKFYKELILRWKVKKTLTQVLSYVVCIQSRRHVQKEHKDKDIWKKMQNILFRKTSFLVLFALGLGLIKPSSLVFWFDIFTRHSLLWVLSCGWGVSLKFVPQDLQWIFYSSLPQLKGRFVSLLNFFIIF